MGVTIADRPYLDIGGSRKDPDEEFNAAQPFLAATELSDGTVVVSDYARLVFFSKDGKYLRSAGHAGSGPGEFSQLRETCLLAGDSILAIDYSSGRLSKWDASGRHIATFPRPGSVPLGACFPNGDVVVRSSTVGGAGPDNRQASEYRIVGFDGVTRRSLGLMPGPTYAGPMAWDVYVKPLGQRLAFANSRNFEVTIYDTVGRPRRIVRVEAAAGSISDAAWQSHLEAMIPNNTPEPQRAAMLARVMSMKKPEVYPALRDMLIRNNAQMWIQDYADPARWIIFDALGSLVGRFDIPQALRSQGAQLKGVALDHVVMLWRDGDGAAHLTFYRIAPASTGGNAGM